MIPIFMAILGAISKQSLRKCPKCGKKQLVPQQKRRETVRCKVCGEEILPGR